MWALIMAVFAAGTCSVGTFGAYKDRDACIKHAQTLPRGPHIQVMCLKSKGRVINDQVWHRP